VPLHAFFRGSSSRLLLGGATERPTPPRPGAAHRFRFKIEVEVPATGSARLQLQPSTSTRSPPATARQHIRTPGSANSSSRRTAEPSRQPVPANLTPHTTLARGVARSIPTPSERPLQASTSTLNLNAREVGARPLHQFSTCSPATRENSPTFAVTKIAPRLSAWPASRTS